MVFIQPAPPHGATRNLQPVDRRQAAHGPVQFAGRKPVDTVQFQTKSLDRQIDNFMAWAEAQQKQLEKQDSWKYVLPIPQRASQPAVPTLLGKPGLLERVKTAFSLLLSSPLQFLRHLMGKPVYKAAAPQNASFSRHQENEKTLALYKQLFPTFTWTGFECSNPHGPGGERWDQLNMTHFYEPEERKRQLEMMLNLGIRNIRLGIPNHAVAETRSWKALDEIMQSIREVNQGKPEAEKIKISLDLQHFGLPDYLRNQDDCSKSLYLHPAWPDHFDGFARAAFKRYMHDLSAITIINEPLITNQFANTHLNEAFPGKGHKDSTRHFIERALLIGEAGVRARAEIEKIQQSQPSAPRKVFIHNESCENTVGDKDFNKYRRFLTSDLLLGHDWLLKDDFTKTDNFRWMEKNFVRPEHPEDRQQLLEQLENIRQAHLDFQKQFDKTMRADTVFGIDYYSGCERGPGISGKVEDYAAEVEVGARKGLYGLAMEYWNRYQLPMLHTETNMTNDHSAEWGRQQLLELAQLKKSGVPVLGFNWYSLIDQFGWDKGLDYKPKEAPLWPVGLFSTRENNYEPRNFTKHVLPELRQALEKSS